MTPSSYADKLTLCAEAACAVDNVLRAAAGLPLRPWEGLEESDRRRWSAWTEQALRGVKMPAEETAIVAAARGVANHLGVLVVSGLTIEEIKATVSRHTGARVGDIDGRGRDQRTSYARHLFMFLARCAGISFPVIARACGDRDHTTVMSANEKIRSLLTKNPRVRADVVALYAMLNLGDEETVALLLSDKPKSEVMPHAA